MESSGPVDLAEYATQALAEAMAWRLDPLNEVPPTDEMFKQAESVVSGMLDLAGRKVIVLVCGSEADAVRLAKACGKNGTHVGEALQVLDRLAEM